MNNTQKSTWARNWIKDNSACSEESTLAAFAQRLWLGWEFVWQLNPGGFSTSSSHESTVLEIQNGKT